MGKYSLNNCAEFLSGVFQKATVAQHGDSISVRYYIPDGSVIDTLDRHNFGGLSGFSDLVKQADEVRLELSENGGAEFNLVFVFAGENFPMRILPPKDPDYQKRLQEILDHGDEHYWEEYCSAVNEGREPECYVPLPGFNPDDENSFQRELAHFAEWLESKSQPYETPILDGFLRWKKFRNSIPRVMLGMEAEFDEPCKEVGAGFAEFFVQTSDKNPNPVFQFSADDKQKFTDLLDLTDSLKFDVWYDESGSANYFLTFIVYTHK